MRDYRIALLFLLFGAATATIPGRSLHAEDVDIADKQSADSIFPGLQSPSVTLAVPRAVNATGARGGRVRLNGRQSTAAWGSKLVKFLWELQNEADAADRRLVHGRDVTIILPAGEWRVTLTATDSAGNVGHDIGHLSVTPYAGPAPRLEATVGGRPLSAPGAATPLLPPLPLPAAAVPREPIGAQQAAPGGFLPHVPVAATSQPAAVALPPPPPPLRPSVVEVPMVPAPAPALQVPPPQPSPPPPRAPPPPPPAPASSASFPDIPFVPDYTEYCEPKETARECLRYRCNKAGRHGEPICEALFDFCGREEHAEGPKCTPPCDAIDDPRTNRACLTKEEQEAIDRGEDV